MQRCGAHHASSNLVYYNASLIAPSDSKTIPAAISDTRSEALISKPEAWECSIVRFDISAGLLPPIVVPMPVPPLIGTTPSRLIATLRSLGIDYKAPLNFFVSSAETSGFVYSIDEFITRLNAAYATAFAAMPPVVGVSSPPIFAFDPITQLITMYAQASYVGGPEIYANSQLYNYLISMPAAFFSYNGANDRDFRIQIEASSAKLLPAAGVGRAGYPISIQNVANTVQSISQAGISLSSMNGVRSVFITTTMPINSEALATTSTAAQNSNYSSNSLPILTDFLVSTEPETNPVVDRIVLAYLPTAEYRMAQMRGAEPLVRVDLKWFYTLYDGTIREVFLPPGGSCSAKIMFRRACANDLLERR